jgi:lysozyme family protein
MDQDIKQLLDKIIEKQEGGWVLTENKDDPDGGWTYAGVARKLWQETIGHPNVTYALIKEDIERSVDEAKDSIYDVYQIAFIGPLQLDKFPETIRGPLLSAAINIGVEQAVKLLQSCLPYAKEDGIVGPETIKLTSTAYQSGVIIKDKFMKAWMRYYIKLVQENAEEWRDAYETAAYACNQYAMGKGMQVYKSPPHTLCATQLEGWFNRVEFWRV